ncbi:MAG: hypothetical protein MK212_07315 [Saprospiraceae bacterium]|nr:hypothetical protein [Saprospiraceae bacterium]
MSKISNEKAKVWELIHTGEKANISLAIALAKSQNIHLDFDPYQSLFELMDKTYPFRSQTKDIGSNLSERLHYILNIKDLNLFQDLITNNISDYFHLLYGLNRISINNINTEVLPNVFCTFPRLKILILNNYKKTLRFLPQHLGQLQYLEKLTVQHLEQTQLPDSITKLSKLQCLHLETDTFLQELPEDFECLTNLQELTISFKNPINPIKYIRQIAQLEQLRSLHLSIEPAIELEDLPDGFYKMYQLEDLELKGIRLKNFPRNLPNREQMHSLHIKHFSFTQLPTSIQEWQGLRWLELTEGNLKNLPHELGQLKQLDTLLIEKNQLTHFPNCLLELTSLETLSLKGNQLKQIPDTISQLGRLSSLNISDNFIQELPDTIKDLQDLFRLDYVNNQLCRLPKVLRKASNINFLYLDKNRIKELPDWIGELKKLEELSLKNNELEQLPDSILKLSGTISEIDLSFNHFKVFPSILFKDSYFIVPDFNANYCYINFDFNQFSTKEIKEVLWCTGNYEDHTGCYSKEFLKNPQSL